MRVYDFQFLLLLVCCYVSLFLRLESQLKGAKSFNRKLRDNISRKRNVRFTDQLSTKTKYHEV